jgi:hypothetical protein
MCLDRPTSALVTAMNMARGFSILRPSVPASANVVGLKLYTKSFGRTLPEPVKEECRSNCNAQPPSARLKNRQTSSDLQPKSKEE